ncbi:prephenate dehydratase [Roseiconus nitratireducens]|uniref:prephenate dehydratase n=1 Tax=Roseiconus nitratireducens TaxID=2605748 RepID=A0A5M6DCA3_9BACT|nr:prephenate dehydratase [Roseiconus nitratireducens]KAA5545191.1 prephenate dehydratase [Roseiconus nitratireducens]
MSASNQLDQIDLELLNLIQRRADLVRGLADSGMTFQAGQENVRLDQLQDSAGPKGAGTPEASESMRQVLRHIASHCRRQIETHRIAILGPKYSYSHLAAIKYFGDAAEFTPVANIPAVFDAVHRGDAESGLVPVENSTDGRVVDTLGMFVRRHMQICGEVLLPIHHNLLASGTREQIREVHSKPQALSQCRGWLMSQLPSATLVEVGSTTAAAESAAGDPTIAAVASLPAGRAYGLNVLNENIEDNPDNVTRFAVLGRHETAPTGNDKTSLLFQIEHQPGALATAMTVFRDAELNLTWIESFPSPGSRSEYLFFVELAGHRADPQVAAAIEKLDSMTRRLEVLGSYPVAVLEE